LSVSRKTIASQTRALPGARQEPHGVSFLVMMSIILWRNLEAHP
jgi:hypothetical protein